MAEYNYNVTGMYCAACASAVERIARRRPDVTAAAVNLATERLVVITDGAEPFEELREAVAKAGYGLERRTAEDDLEKRRDAELKAERNRVIISAVFAVPLFYLGMGHMLPFGLELPLPSWLDMNSSPVAFAVVQAVLALVVMICGKRFYVSGFRALFQLSPNMDTLVALGTISAFGYGVWSIVRILGGDTSHVHRLFFESVGTVITLVMLGKYLETRSRRRAAGAIKKLGELRPETATVLRGEKEMQVPASALAPGDVVLVQPGGRFPADGKVISGESSADNSLITGESMPIPVAPGDEVIGGAINGEGQLRCEVTAAASESMLDRMIALVENAQSRKAPIARIADKVASVFVPCVLAIAVLAAVIWAISGADVEFVVNVFVSVLVIACPCAMGLATPTAILAGSGRGAELGILIKSGEALEALAKTEVVVVDKTGTLTEGRPQVTSAVFTDGVDELELLGLAAAAERGSTHPAAVAFIDYAEKRGADCTAAAEDVRALPGRGVEATVGGHSVLAGNSRLMSERGIGENGMDTENAQICVAVDGRLCAVFGFADALKSDSRGAIEHLHALGVKSVMLTGDRESAAEKVAREAGVDEYYAQVLPDGKAQYVEKIRQTGARVAMIGDGINDAPALAAADVGVAIGGGTDVAIESADVVLVHGDMSRAADAVELARATRRNIVENLFWAFCYNTVGIPIAAGALYFLDVPLLNPGFAGAAMALSSVSVVTNALRLRRWKPKRR